MPLFPEISILSHALTLTTQIGRPRLARATALVGLAALAASTPAFAQSIVSGNRNTASREHRVLGQSSVVTGIVRDPSGVPLMGAIVELLDGAAAVRAGAVTDLHGRYLVANLLPGRYQVRASATLSAPSVRKLQLRSGAEAVVDLTVGTLFDSTSWLPAERRRADEPADDWKWTLRSAAHRPILRDLDPCLTPPGEHSSRSSIKLQAGVERVSGKFAQSGRRQTLLADLQHGETAQSAIRADVVTPSSHSVQPTSQTFAFASFAVAQERHLGPAGTMRVSATHTSASGLLGPAGMTSINSLQLSSGEQISLGDLAEIEVGSRLTVLGQNGSSTVETLPFLRVLTHPAESWTAGYNLATARDLQELSDIGPSVPDLPTASRVQGRLRAEHGLHQRASVRHTTHRSSIEAAFYHDNLDRVTISGVQTSGAAQLSGADAAIVLSQVAPTEAASLLNAPQSSSLLFDPASGSFRSLARGYAASGWDIAWTEDLSPNLRITVAYSSGAALALTPPNGSTRASISASESPASGNQASENVDRLTRTSGQTATVAVKANLRGSGTKLRAAYRWQPERLITPVDAYSPAASEAYLGMHVRQPIHAAYLGTRAVELSADAVNLLAQGYRRVPTATPAQACFLASAPRTLQAGLAFFF